jgi:hypothetical protein
MVDVGYVTESGFDITDVNEQDQLLIKTDEGGVVKTRWIYKDTNDKLIIHERSESHPDVAAKGSYLEIGLAGYAVASLTNTYDNKKVAKLLADINWSDTSPFHTQTITIDGEAYLGVLAPVKLL